jgi:hypothetical protein
VLSCAFAHSSVAPLCGSPSCPYSEGNSWHRRKGLHSWSVAGALFALVKNKAAPRPASAHFFGGLENPLCVVLVWCSLAGGTHPRCSAWPTVPLATFPCKRTGADGATRAHAILSQTGRFCSFSRFPQIPSHHAPAARTPPPLSRKVSPCPTSNFST